MAKHQPDAVYRDPASTATGQSELQNQTCRVFADLGDYCHHYSVDFLEPPTSFASPVRTLATVLVSGGSAYGPFTSVLAHTRDVAAHTVGSSLEALLAGAVRLDPGVASRVALAARLVLIVPIGVTLVRLRRDDTQWAFAWTALLVMLPQLWSHYVWVAPALLGVALAERDRSDRAMAWLSR